MQSALLEVMQEHQVTIGHETHPVPDPFLVMATQNPIESEGTYPLPEAQIDRFLLKIVIGYPAHDEELTIVQRQLVPHPELRQVLTLDELRELQRATVAVYVDPALISYAVELATATRTPASYGLVELSDYIAFGASPRGPIGVVQAARALALLHGRDESTSRTSTRSRATPSATASCSRTRRWPRKRTRSGSSTPCSPPCQCPRSTWPGRAPHELSPRAGTAGAGRCRRDLGRLEHRHDRGIAVGAGLVHRALDPFDAGEVDAEVVLHQAAYEQSRGLGVERHADPLAGKVLGRGHVLAVHHDETVAKDARDEDGERDDKAASWRRSGARSYSELDISQASNSCPAAHAVEDLAGIVDRRGKLRSIAGGRDLAGVQRVHAVIEAAGEGDW